MTEKLNDLISAWQHVPVEIDCLVAGHSDKALASIPGSEGLSVKEVVHHLTEANIVAASMIIAALGASGSTFDWSWLWPNREWNDKLQYEEVPLQPSIKTLRGLIEHISNLISVDKETLEREIRLFDTPGGETYVKTVADLVQQEVDHATQHLSDARNALLNWGAHKRHG